MYYTIALSLSNFRGPRDHARAKPNLSSRPCPPRRPRLVHTMTLIYSNTDHLSSGTWAPLSPPDPLTFSGVKTHEIPRVSSCPSLLITCCSARCDPTDAVELCQRGRTYWCSRSLYVLRSPSALPYSPIARSSSRCSEDVIRVKRITTSRFLRVSKVFLSDSWSASSPLRKLPSRSHWHRHAKSRLASGGGGTYAQGKERHAVP